MEGMHDNEASIDYMPGSDVFDYFRESESECSDDAAAAVPVQVIKEKEKRIVLKSSKAPRPHDHYQHQEESPLSEEEEEEEVEDYKPDGNARKIPYIPRMTKQYKSTILKMIKEKQLKEREERMFQKDLLQFYHSHARVTKLLTPLASREPLTNLGEPPEGLKMTTSFLDYSKLAPLLYQGLLKFDTSEKGRLRIFSGERLILNIYVKV